MQKKIMIAVDDSSHSLRAVRFAAQMATTNSNLHCLLFHLEPAVSGFLVEEAKTDMHAQRDLDRVKKKNRRAAADLLERYRNQMASDGASADRIEMISVPRKLGLAKDIIDYAQEKRLDAVVMGRRGLGALQEVMLGSVTAKVVEHSNVVPVWIVDDKVAADRILVAMDGSEHALRALDHAAFMMSGNPNAHLTLFHVKGRGEALCEPSVDDESLDALVDRASDRVMAACELRYDDVMKAAGFDEGRFSIEMGDRRRNVGKAVLEAADKGGYGVVVVGRSGQSRSFFMGSVSRYVINQVAGRSVWLVP
jgi:nucleotide-binding universal stress UspA family protein